MSNMPNVQQASAVSQGAQASISEANRMAATREQMRGQQAMQQQAMQARAAEAEKERGFQAQRDLQQMGLEQQKMAQAAQLAQQQNQLAQQRMSMDQQQFSEAQALRKEQFAEQKRVQQYQESEAAKDKQLAAMQFKLQQKALRATAQEKQSIRQQMASIATQRSDIAARMAKTRMLQNLTEQELKQLQSTLGPMEERVKTLRDQSMKGGESIANFVVEEVSDKSSVRARDFGRGLSPTILGFEAGDFPVIGEQLRLLQAKGLSNEELGEALFGVSLENPGLAGAGIYQQLETRTDEIGAKIAQDSLVPSFAKALSRQSNIEIEDATKLSKVVFEAIVNNEDTDLAKLIQDSTAQYGINGLVMSNAISSLVGVLEDRATEMQQAAVGDKTFSDTTLGIRFAGEQGIPTQAGMLNLYGKAIDGLAQKMRLATMSTEHMNTNFDTMLQVINEVKGVNFSDLTSGMGPMFDRAQRQLFEEAGVDLGGFDREQRQLLDAISKAGITGNLQEGLGQLTVQDSAADRKLMEQLDLLTSQAADSQYLLSPADEAALAQLMAQ